MLSPRHRNQKLTTSAVSEGCAARYGGGGAGCVWSNLSGYHRAVVQLLRTTSLRVCFFGIPRGTCTVISILSLGRLSDSVEEVILDIPCHSSGRAFALRLYDSIPETPSPTEPCWDSCTYCDLKRSSLPPGTPNVLGSWLDDQVVVSVLYFA